MLHINFNNIAHESDEQEQFIRFPDVPISVNLILIYKRFIY